MNVVLHCRPLYDLHPFPLTQISYYLYYALFVLVVDDLLSKFQHKNDVLLTHPLCVC